MGNRLQNIQPDELRPGHYQGWAQRKLWSIQKEKRGKWIARADDDTTIKADSLWKITHLIAGQQP